MRGAALVPRGTQTRARRSSSSFAGITPDLVQPAAPWART